MTKSATDFKEAGNRHFQENKFDEAIKLYSKAIDIKEDPSFYTNRCLCYMKLKNWELAADDCRRVLELDSRNVKVSLNFSLIYLSILGKLLFGKDSFLSGPTRRIYFDVNACSRSLSKPKAKLCR